MSGCLGCEKECEKVWGCRALELAREDLGIEQLILRQSHHGTSESIQEHPRPLFTENHIPLNKLTAYSRFAGGHAARRRRPV